MNTNSKNWRMLTKEDKNRHATDTNPLIQTRRKFTFSVALQDARATDNGEHLYQWTPLYKARKAKEWLTVGRQTANTSYQGYMHTTSAKGFGRTLWRELIRERA